MLDDHTVSRRSLLAGLAAASTLAAGAVTRATAETPETPELLRLGDQIPEAERLYREALAHQRAVEREGSRRFPETPDALFVKRGGAYERTFGEYERRFDGGARFRKGEEKPRRVILRSHARFKRDQAADALAHKRMAKHGKLYGRDRAAWERQYEMAKPLAELAESYYAECDSLRAELDHDGAWKDTRAKSRVLSELITSIMALEERTMEGVMVKANALAAWGCVDVLWTPGMQDWGPRFAAAVLRQANAGAVA